MILNRTSVVAEPPELLAQILWLVHVCNKDELPDIDPVFESKEKPSGRLGLISHVEGVLYGWKHYASFFANSEIEFRRLVNQPNRRFLGYLNQYVD